MVKRFLIYCLVCCLTLTIFGCASSQPMVDQLGRIETRQKTERSESVAEFQELKREIDALKSRLDTVSKAQADLMASMDRQNELMQNAVENMKQNDVPTDSIPMTGMNTSGFGSGYSSSSESVSEPDQRPEVVYQTAYNDYINRNYDLAILEFQSFLSAFPESALADNAQYWIGECYYSQQKFKESLIEFNKVIQMYPDGDKFIPAMLKKGLSQMETGNVQSGQRVLEKLVEDYPYSNEARIAQDRLDNP